jgi:hypothetical protein
VNRMIGTGQHAKPREVGRIEVRREVHAANKSEEVRQNGYAASRDGSRGPPKGRTLWPGSTRGFFAIDGKVAARTAGPRWACRRFPYTEACHVYVSSRWSYSEHSHRRRWRSAPHIGRGMLVTHKPSGVQRKCFHAAQCQHSRHARRLWRWRRQRSMLKRDL